jgi:hypothetical protein
MQAGFLSAPDRGSQRSNPGEESSAADMDSTRDRSGCSWRLITPSTPITIITVGPVAITIIAIGLVIGPVIAIATIIRVATIVIATAVVASPITNLFNGDIALR